MSGPRETDFERSMLLATAAFRDLDRDLIEKIVPRAVWRSLPAPEKIWRLTMNGISTSTVFWKSLVRATR